MSSAGNNFYLQFFQSVLLPAGWTAPPQHIGEGTPAERLDLGCYSAHIFSRSVVIHGTIRRGFFASRVVIRSTVCASAVVIGNTISGLLFTTQFGSSGRGLLFPTQGKTVVIHGTVQAFSPKSLLLSAAQFDFGLLFSAQFAGVVIGSTFGGKTGKFPPVGYRYTAVFLRWSCYSRHSFACC